MSSEGLYRPKTRTTDPPASPVGYVDFYFKSGVWYFIDSAGVITAFSTGAGITSLSGDVTGTGPGATSTTVALVGGKTASAVATAVSTIEEYTTKGDILARSTTDPDRLAVGSNDFVLLADSTQTLGLRYAANMGSVGITVDGAAVLLTTGQKGYVTVPFDATITGWDLIADQVGSVVFDVWKVSNAVPTIANTITASAKPTLTAAQQVESTTLTGWTTSVAAGDVFGFNIDSVSTITRVTLTLRVRKK